MSKIIVRDKFKFRLFPKTIWIDNEKKKLKPNSEIIFETNEDYVILSEKKSKKRKLGLDLENKEKVLVFYVKGSGKKPYRVAFWKEENSRDIHSGCGCPAGKRMQYCKHRFQLIEGDLTNLDDSTENAKEKLEILYNWLEDSDIGDFFEDFT